MCSIPCSSKNTKDGVEKNSTLNDGGKKNGESYCKTGNNNHAADAGEFELEHEPVHLGTVL